MTQLQRRPIQAFDSKFSEWRFQLISIPEKKTAKLRAIKSIEMKCSNERLGIIHSERRESATVLVVFVSMDLLPPLYHLMTCFLLYSLSMCECDIISMLVF